jgi:hypothetical protein
MSYIGLRVKDHPTKLVLHPNAHTFALMSTTTDTTKETVCLLTAPPQFTQGIPVEEYFFFDDLDDAKKWLDNL